MIKRLRKKFILTNMLLVALVLITVFGVLVGYNYQRLVRQSEEAMRTALKWSDDAPPPVFQFGASHEEEMEEQGEERRFTMVPVFVVLLDEDGGPAQVTGGNNVEVSDQVVAQAVATATEESGAISGLNPRSLQDTDRGGEQPDRLCRYGLGDRLTVAADPLLAAGGGAGPGRFLRHLADALRTGPQAGGGGVGAAAPLCGGRLS